MYADQLEAEANKSVKQRLHATNDNTHDFGPSTKPTISSAKRQREDDKWEHDLFDDNESKLSNRRVGSNDLRLKLQRKSHEHLSSSGGVRDLREKLSGKLFSRSIQNGSVPLRPKPAHEVSRPSRKSAVAEAPDVEIKKLASSISKKKTQHDADAVDNFLRSLDLMKYSITFQAEEVDMTTLVHMSEEDLIALGIPMGPRKKILIALETKV